MKKTTLLFSALAVASTAFAAMPEVNSNFQGARLDLSEVQVPALRMIDGQKVFNGPTAIKNGKVLNKVAKKAPGFSVSYDEPEGLFGLGMSYPTGYSYNGSGVHRGPAWKPLTWINTSVGATEFEWEYMQFDSGEPGYSYESTRDLVFTPIWSEIPGPTLYGIAEDGTDDNFMLGGVRSDEGDFVRSKLTFLFGGGGEEQVDKNDPSKREDFGITTYLYSYNGGGYGTVPVLAYNPADRENNPVTGLDPVFTDPEPNGFGMSNPVFKGYANIFKAPAAPYVMSRMWCLMAYKVTKATTVQMDLYKLTEDGRISDELIASGTASLTPSGKDEYNFFHFDLFTLDEDGLETDEPIIIDCAYVAIMTVNKADFAEICPAIGAGATYPVSDPIEYQRNALMIIEDEGDEQFLYCPFQYYTDESRKNLLTVTDYMWMVDAYFPWLAEINGKTIAEAPVTGGEASFVINSSYDLTTLDLSFSDEANWITKAEVDEDAAYNQIVFFECEALPEGLEGRSTVATIEGPGVSLDLTIAQGEGAAVSVVVSDKDAQYFDLQGRRVANPEKGIYIRKAGNKAEKVIL